MPVGVRPGGDPLATCTGWPFAGPVGDVNLLSPLDFDSLTYVRESSPHPPTGHRRARLKAKAMSDEPSRAGFETKRKRVTTAARGRDAQVVTPAGFGSPRDMARLDVLPWILRFVRFSHALFLVCTVLVMPHSTFRSLFACLVCVHSNQTNACQGARRSSRGPSPQRDDGDPRSGWLRGAKRGDGSVGLGP